MIALAGIMVGMLVGMPRIAGDDREKKSRRPKGQKEAG
jgi:hypothetical protein